MIRRFAIALALCLLPCAALADMAQDVTGLANLGPRVTGSPSADAAANFIEQRFRDLGLEEIGRQRFLTPLRQHHGSSLALPDGRSVGLTPVELNAITPGAVPGFTGPVVAVGQGRLQDMNGLPVQDSILLMDLNSGRNWVNAATLGARAVIYVDSEQGSKFAYGDKFEATPIDFPRFLLSKEQAGAAFPGWDTPGIKAEAATLTSSVTWERAQAENVYAFIPGADQALGEELIIVEAFYDANSYTYGQHGQGADQASSAAALLHLAERLKADPPARSVLLVATSGHGQGLAGWREFLWAARSKGKYLRDLTRHQTARLETSQRVMQALENSGLELGPTGVPELAEAFNTEIKDEVERLSTRLMRLRLAAEQDRQALDLLTSRRMLLRGLTFALGQREITPQERVELESFIPAVRQAAQAKILDAKQQLDVLKSARGMRNILAVREIAATVSLHISSHGPGLGAFRNRGFTYDIRPDRNYSGAYSAAADALDEISGRLNAEEPAFVNCLRPSRIRPWESWLPDKPSLGGEYASLANYVGLSLATVDDARPWWGTPHDTLETVDFANLAAQAELAAGLISGLANHPRTLHEERPRLGFASLDGRTTLLRQGELFAEQPAPDVVVYCMQGNGIYYAMSDTEGAFRVTGLGSKKVIVGKAILEPYKFGENGRVVLAADKPGTGKDAYRVKMNRILEETRLIMFPAAQMTALNLLEPRTFDYMTKVDLFDARRDTEPNKYWYSRADTRDSTLLSLYMDPDTPLKFTLSDSVLTRKLLLTGAEENSPQGEGYRPSAWSTLPVTELLAAQDMWSLLAPRVDNLEEHGVVNDRVRELEKRGRDGLREAVASLEGQRYDQAMESARDSFALAGRVYNDVSATQKDVLLGVLFYIALFIPFAYCVERVIFACADIKKRIVAFLGILMSVIFVVYKVHPAFQLTYSPAVVILAFFILGLSLLVSGIIFMRFEREMSQLAMQAKRGGGEVGLWKAFGAAFVIGVSNLRRRKLRTALTVLTLVILTFTIMSFTAVKSVRREAAAPFLDTAPYAGLLLRKLDWSSLPPEALGIVSNAFHQQAVVGPRVWKEGPDRTTEPFVTLAHGRKTDLARGMIGLSADEPAISGLDAALISGRWFAPGETRAVLLPSQLAERLNAGPGGVVALWGLDFRVTGVFDEQAFAEAVDLDGEVLTPATFPSETLMDLAELEAEEAEDGQAMTQMQSRYEHSRPGQTIVVPASTLVSLGGELKAVALKPRDESRIEILASQLTDRFGLTLFVGLPNAGESGGAFVYHASDSLDYAGLPTIVVPVLLAALIVLNTMIASVHERRREIGIYTSLGMAPTHVSFLFIAEAVAFAVISVVLGYLLAQVSAAFLAGTSLWAGMTANYSSTAGVAAMVLVMAVVLLSVIYPSKVAAAIAIPDVNRSWTMPPAENGSIRVTLPFLLKYDEQLCVGGYLLDYYRSHQDVSHGRFTSEDVKAIMACPAPGLLNGDIPPLTDCLQLDFKAWLAPFDFGVAQQVNMTFCPSSISPEFLEIKVTLTRVAGEARVWERLNKGFLNDLRKQLLIWRSLETEARTSYEQELGHLRENLDQMAAEVGQGATA